MNDWSPEKSRLLDQERMETESICATPLGKLKAMTLSKRQRDQIENTKWIIPNVIAQGMLHVFAAKYNGGKTTLFTYWWAGQMVDSGKEVIYVQADIGAGQAKVMSEFAEWRGYTLATPGITEDTSIDDVMIVLNQLKDEKGSLEDCVLIVDTLKKFTDLNQKGVTKKVFELFRALTRKGLTVILLSHTVKHENESGVLVFEGTNEVATECDNLIMLDKVTQPDGSMLVSTRIEKERVPYEPLTIEIRFVEDGPTFSYVDNIDLNVLGNAQDRLQDDESIITAIQDSLTSGPLNQQQVIAQCESIPVNRIRQVLERYTEGHGAPRIPEHWRNVRGDKNASIYSLLPPAEKLEN